MHKRSKYKNLRAASLAGIITLSGLLQALPVAAATPKSLGVSRDWDALEVSDGDAKTCYLRAAPVKSLPANANRGEIFLFVTHRSKPKTVNEISFISGYPFKPGSNVNVSVGGLKLSLFTEGDGAWLEKPADEARLVNAMKQGSELVITGTSARGTKTTDHYSLQGFTAGLKTISKACGVKA